MSETGWLLVFTHLFGIAFGFLSGMFVAFQIEGGRLLKEGERQRRRAEERQS